MRRRHVLYVEDNPGDAELVREALRPYAPEIELEVVENGSRALEFLSRSGQRFAHAPRPDLVLLDLSLPVLDGARVADAMRRLAAWRDIPVVVLSSSTRPEDVQAAYASGATLYLAKPADWERYESFASGIARLVGAREPTAKAS